MSHSDADPALVFGTLNAYQQSAALRGAIDLDLFTAIGSSSATAEEIAQRCRASGRGIRILCDFLVVHKFLTKSSDRYQLSATAAEFLDKKSPRYMGSIAQFMHSPPMLAAFRDVAQLARQGTTMLDAEGTVSHEFDGWVDFAQSMAPIMMPAAKFIAAHIADSTHQHPDTQPLRVLDIAAGHGMFGICVARRTPNATIVAMDWPAVLEVAQRNADRWGVANRYQTLPGDAMQTDLGGNYDWILITNFLHHFDEATCGRLLQRCRQALKPSGRLLTLEFVPNADRVTPPMPATFSMTMLATTPAGDAYTFEDYERMLLASGFRSNRMLDVPNSTQRLLISC